MDCSEIRQGFRTGGIPSGPLVDAHLKECAHCAELFGDAATLGRRLAGVEARDADSVKSLLASTESLIAREHGLRAFLRSRPTQMRWALSLVLPAALLARELLRQRVPLSELGVLRVIAGLLLLGAFVLIARSALRPPPIERRAARVGSVLSLVAWCLPCVFWLVPEAGGSTDGDFALRSLTCFSYGSALGAPSFVLLWAFDRGQRISYRVVALGAGLVAVLASLLLLLHCPNTQCAHLVAGHFSIGLVWFAAVSIAASWRAS